MQHLYFVGVLSCIFFFAVHGIAPSRSAVTCACADLRPDGTVAGSSTPSPSLPPLCHPHAPSHSQTMGPSLCGVPLFR
jgi:hypothetical protein